MPMIRTALTLVVLGGAALLSGCADYLNNRDTVAFGAGDAVAWNRAAHKVNPYNRDSYAKSIRSDGTAVVVAQKRRYLPLGITTAPAATAAPAPAPAQ
jgi:hypothetical protein